MTDNGRAIQIESLRFSYPDGTVALDDLCLEVAEGEKVAVLGANGAGKSTLLLHLNGILRGGGSVRVCGLQMSRATAKTIRRMVGVVFQNPDDQLFCPTVGDDVAFGPRNLNLPEEEVGRRVAESLAAVGMSGSEERSAFHLSFGQKKRVAIATALAMQPRIMALDEPTSNLDPRGRREIAALLRRLGRTQVIVTHDLELVGRLCDRAVVLAEGRKAADGPIARILADERLLDSCGLR